MVERTKTEAQTGALNPSGGVVAAPAAAGSAPATATAPARKSQPFWLGGVASMGAACVSHPLDLLKVRQQLQTAAANPAASASSAASSATLPAASASASAPAVRPKSEGMIRLALGIIRTEGALSLYSGLSASLLRQASYSTVRFGVYEGLKARRLESMAMEDSLAGAAAGSAVGGASPARCPPRPRDLSMRDSIAFSLAGGALGGVVGNPADLVNVRMQNDKKLAPDCRRNYRGVFEALLRISREEGVTTLWNGVGPNVLRAMLMTSGQLASYDAFKNILVRELGADERNVGTHLMASCLAGVVATVMTQPVDVVKTRVMNAGRAAAAAQAASAPLSASAATAAACTPAPVGTLSLVRHMLVTEGAGAFFKGFIPALTRLGPHTVATFLLLEQLKKLVA